MTLQIRRGGTPFVLGDPIVEPVPAAGALLNVHIRAVLEILAELKRARPAQAKSVAGDLAAAERLLHSPLVADFAHGYSKPSSAPQQQAQQSAADKLRGQVLEARGGDHKRLGAWKDDEYAVSPYFESLTEQRNVLANAAVTEKLAAEIDERAGLLKSGARLAQEERRSASIVIASAQGAVDSFLRETVVPLVINSIRDAHSSIASPTRSPKASPKRMKTRAAVSRRFSNKGALTKPLEGEDNLGYFQEELPMLIADQVNLWWSSVRERMQTLLLEASQMFSEDGVDDVDFSKAFETLVFAGKAVTASHGEGAVVCAEDWTAPLFDHAMEFVKERMGELERKAHIEIQEGGNGVKYLNALESIVEDKLMPHYLHRIAEVKGDLASQVATLVRVVRDLNPKYARIYTATGGLVRGADGYHRFLRTEHRIFEPINVRGKPSQPVRTVPDLVALSARGKKTFDECVWRVVKAARKALRGGGGMEWKPAPIKRTARIVEKLCLNPTQQDNLATRRLATLNASGILDTVRGMIICSSMPEASAVLHALEQESSRGGASGRPYLRLVRSKNRFRNPSSGGWMDCLINVRLVGNIPSEGLVCELQIVHQQLLTVRAELGAHHSYNMYRAAAELLECVHADGLVGDHQERKRQVLGRVLASFSDGKGQPVDESAATDHCIASQAWGVNLQMPGRAWPTILLLELPPVVQTLLPGDEIAEKVLSKVLAVGFGGVARPTALHLAKRMKSRLLSWKAGGAVDGPSVRSVCTQGDHVFTGHEDGSVSGWAVNDGALAFTVQGHESTINSLAVSGDGSRLVSGGDDAVAKLWDFDGASLAHVCDLAGHTEKISVVCMSSNAKFSITASWDTTARLWSNDSGQHIRSFEGHSSLLYAACLSADGQTLITGSDDKTARVWNVNTGESVHVLTGHTGGVSAVAMSNDGGHAVTGSWDKTARVWALAVGESLRELKGHTAVVTAVTVSPDSKIVFTGSADRTIQLWELETGMPKRKMKGHIGAVTSLCVLQDGEHVISGSEDGTARQWIVHAAAATRHMIGHTDSVNCVCVHPGKSVISGSSDNTARVWSAADCAQTAVLSGHTGAVNSISVSPGGEYVLTASDDQTVRVWSMKSGKTVRELLGHADKVFSVAVGNDGIHVVTGSDDKTARVWDLDAGTTLRELRGHSRGVACVCISPECDLIGTGSWDHTVCVWNLSTGEKVHQLEGHRKAVTSICMTPDGKQLVSGSKDATARLWSLEEGALIHEFVGHTRSVLSVTVTPDGRYVVTGSKDKTVRVWGTINGDFLREIVGHADAVNAVCVTQSGRALMTASADKRVFSHLFLENGS